MNVFVVGTPIEEDAMCGTGKRDKAYNGKPMVTADISKSKFHFASYNGR